MKVNAIAAHALAGVAMSAACANAGLDWDTRARNAIAAARVTAAAGQSALALVRGAMSEASRSGNGNGSSGGTAPVLGAAAASVAAYVVLECLFPEQQPGLEAELAVSLADFAETQQKADALARGRRVATELLRFSEQSCGSSLVPR